MPIGNGGIIGPANVPTITTASGVWSLREQQQAQGRGVWPLALTQDPYFEYTTLLLPGNGTNGANNNTFLDGSTNNFTITRNGNTTQGTFSPFSQTGWGNYFDGNGDYLQTPNNAAFNLSSGSFTIEAWVYRTNPTTSDYVFWSGTATGSNSGLNFYVGGDSKLYIDNGVTGTTGYGSVSGNQWIHVALIRDGGNGYLYVNGVCANPSTPVTQAIGTGGIGLIGCAGITTQGNFDGYISNLRIVKGQALVTGGANFTPPTGPVNATQVGWNGSTTALTGTCSIVTCQSNRFIDNSSNAFTITVNGNTSVVAFSPFNPTLPWSAVTNGGSGYFDGNGDYLSVASNTALDITQGNFTFECWVYRTVSATQEIWNQRINSPSAIGVFLRLNSTNTITFSYVGTASAITSTSTIPLNSWTHLAVTRSSSTVSIFINGNLDATASFANGTYAATNLLIGRDETGTGQYTGYLSNWRLIKGVALYTTSFTPPTAPLTAITNTSLLLNYTNAGIYDATSKNDLETVGNAQISTTQSKWGGSSMYFDGNGDYLSVPPNTQSVLLGSSPFTIEFWIYRASSQPSTRTPIIAFGNTYTNNFWAIQLNNTTPSYINRIQLWVYNINSSAVTAISTGTISETTWTHVAIVRSGSDFRIFINGTQDGTGSSSASMDGGSTTFQFQVGYSSPDYFNGYLQDVRITKGYARYVTGTGGNAGKMVFNGTNDLALPTAAFPTL